MNNFGIKFKQVPLLCDNENPIKLLNNPVQHVRTKHIDVRHHFIRDHQQKGDICIESVGTEDISHLNRLIHENQINLMLVWYHYCLYV